MIDRWIDRCHTVDRNLSIYKQLIAIHPTIPHSLVLDIHEGNAVQATPHTLSHDSQRIYPRDRSSSSSSSSSGTRQWGKGNTVLRYRGQVSTELTTQHVAPTELQHTEVDGIKYSP